MRLIPKDETFWEFFTKETGALTLASDLLHKGMQDGHSELAGVAVRLKAIERESSRSLQDLQLRLHKTFVTPVDPEDISLLFEHLDHMLDSFEAISYRMMAYHLEPIPPLMVDLAGCLHTSTDRIQKAFSKLSVSESNEDLCQEIREIKEQTGHLIREGITRLFSAEKDPIALLKQKDIYDNFESLNNATQELANVLQNVSIKNS